MSSALGILKSTALIVKGMFYWSREAIRKTYLWVNMIALDKVSYGHLTYPRTRYTDDPHSPVKHSLV